MSEKYFDDYARSYDKNLEEALKVVNVDAKYFTEYKIKQVKNFYLNKNKQPTNILDFGCGIGNSSDYLSQYFKESEIYGIDVSNESIEMAQKKNLKNCQFKLYNGEDIPFLEEFFVVIFISNVFHHIDHNKHVELLKKLKKTLKKEGILFLFEHNTLNPLTLKVVNECIFDKDAKLLNYWYSKKIFNLAGFTKNKIKFILFIPPKFKWLIFLEKYLYWLPFGGQYMSISKR